MKKKLMAVALATIIVVMAVAGSSLAWLKETTPAITNTFTEGLVDIDLYEHKYENGALTGTIIRDDSNSYKMVPGSVLPKDPTVTVLAESEACWLFVKVDEINDVNTFLSYAIADGWTQGDGTNIPSNVYYRKVDDTNVEQVFYVLKADSNNTYPHGAVTVNSGVTMTDMKGLSAANYPKLQFTAYAIQAASFDNVANAWAEVQVSP